METVVLNDSEREVRIEAARLRLQFARTPDDVRSSWDDLTDLVRGRSWAQVERMEAERGLL